MNYQQTPEEKELTRQLEEFREALRDYSKARNSEDKEAIRNLINRRIQGVAEIVRLAGCRRTFTISPPPAVGGYVMNNMDPFLHVFESAYGRSFVSVIVDMIDQTIGVIESGKFGEISARLKKAAPAMGPISGTKVFLVHGHDEGVREAVARFIEKLGLEAIVLHEQASAGRTIIEKVEAYAGVAFAIVILTPDDVGAERGQEENLRGRARQNVILELGYFVGRLGRSHVAALVKGDIERPSDYDGVVYIPFDSVGAWMMVLARELQEAGLAVDLNDAAR